MTKEKKYLLYRIYYDNILVYVGRTNQSLKDRIRSHLFKKPMHRSLDIKQITKIEYSKFTSEADRNLYEIYFINLWKPILNVDDKCKDKLTVFLPEINWIEFKTDLWNKWKKEIEEKEKEYKSLQNRNNEILEEIRILRALRKTGELSENDFYNKYYLLKEEQSLNNEKLTKSKDFF